MGVEEALSESTEPVPAIAFRVSVSWARVSGFGSRDSGFGFRVLDFGCRVKGCSSYIKVKGYFSRINNSSWKGVGLTEGAGRGGVNRDRKQ